MLRGLQADVADRCAMAYRRPLHEQAAEQLPSFDVHVRVREDVREESFAADLAGIPLRTVLGEPLFGYFRRSAAVAPPQS